MGRNLHLRGDKFGLGIKFTVKDESGADAYIVKGKWLTMHSRYEILDPSQAVVAEIHQKNWSWRPTFILKVQGFEYAKIIKRLRWGSRQYTIELNQDDLTVVGKWYSGKGEIQRNGKTISRIDERRLSWGADYRIQCIEDAIDLELLAVGLAVAMRVIQMERASASSGGGN